MAEPLDRPRKFVQHCQRFACFLRNWLGCPCGFIGGDGTGFEAGGSSLLRMARMFLTRDRGKRSAAIASRSSAAIAARSSGGKIRLHGRKLCDARARCQPPAQRDMLPP